ncbi:hypothetical protein D805_0670 [Bifidobacterium thermophilum RBL67]|uniref:Uncharacterized protein n=1 Tax=Bifidobacterium thermophilum RBL67 TaxID=1254439 RepID=M4RQY9_9BIFI|nr:hypothetical protein D805_0670 [Bifidobacterium thermophilum RBL67]
MSLNFGTGCKRFLAWIACASRPGYRLDHTSPRFLAIVLIHHADGLC